MKREDKLKFILKVLNELFPDPKPSLLFEDTYTLLIAVLLSAHTTDTSVNRVTPSLFSKANTPEKMVKLSISEIQKIIKPCGLSPQKAKYIWELSKKLIDNHGGHVPSSFHDLEALPGVGHKTASVVLTQGFHQNTFPVDTHIHRLAKRWGLSNAKNVKETEKDLKKFFPEKSWGKVHLQMIYYGRLYCPARNHKIQNCPICNFIK